ncbi:MAG: methionine adenosyltransferase [Deltaproteobacteria bacterium]|nr:methionine adenosyltransferase [Deltaproteobacteria bacterium]MBW2306973.1 methionine adenosyltransferase [Deltaproteobacteria bacterium]
MSMTNFLFTSESITEGHPDKIADQISDAILDAVIKDDPAGRVAVETLIATGVAVIAGQITTTTWVDIPQVVRDTIREIGYNNSSMGFDWETCAVLTSIDKQSADIAIGVDETEDREQGAGDQGFMFGYACNETPELMPMPIIFAHKLTKRLAQVRKAGILDFLRPDGKSQVSVQYVDDKPVRVDSVVIAAQHKPAVNIEALREAIMEEVIQKIIPSEYLDNKTKYFINSTGRFVTGGPVADTGLTGRKIIVDTYGGQGSHGGGCFSGKDPSKVDRSASYMARYIAKNLVAAELCEKVEVQIAYTIGVAEPVSVMINTFGSGKIPSDDIARIVREIFPLKPRRIIETLDLLRPIYKKTAVYGHFGRNDPDFTWEKMDKIDDLRQAARL